MDVLIKKSVYQEEKRVSVKGDVGAGIWVYLF